MKNILLPTDYSACANNAFVYALSIANKLKIKLFVLHSYQPPVLSFSHAGQPELLNEVYQEMEVATYERFKHYPEQLKKIAEENGLDYSDVTFLFEDGAVVDCVREVVVRENIDLIIMGTLGASGFKQTFIGTNTVNIIKNVNIPLLAVPQDAKYTGLSKIAFTTLFRDVDLQPLKETSELAKAFQSSLYCVHVMAPSSKPADILEYSEKWRKAVGEADLEFVLLEQTDTVENTINKFIQDNHIDVLTVVKRNRSFFDRLVSSSLSNNLTFHAKTPILVFSEK